VLRLDEVRRFAAVTASDDLCAAIAVMPHHMVSHRQNFQGEKEWLTS
jgi:hypothetical protein